MRPEQLPLLTSVSAPSLSPDGTWAVVSTSRPDFDADSYVGQLWRVPTDGEGTPRRLTRGFADSNPQVSPDGSTIAFLRRSPGKPAQLAVVDAAGGEPQVITDTKLGISEFTFSPDGRMIALTSRIPDEGRYGDIEDIKPGQEDPRVFTGNKMRMNGLGWHRDRPSQVFLVEVPDLQAEPPVMPVGRAKKARAAELGENGAVSPLVPESVRLTDDRHDWHDLAFTGDGDSLVATAALHEGQEDDLVSDLWLLPLKGGDRRQLTAGLKKPLSVSDPVVVGDTVFFHGREMPAGPTDFVGHHASIWSVPVTGAEPPHRVTDRTLTMASPLVEHDGGVVFSDNHRGTGRLFHCTPAGELTRLTDGELVASAPDAASGAVVCRVTHAMTMGEVAVLRDGQLHVLTDFSRPLVEAMTIVEPVELTATAPDGYPVHGWVLTPTGEGPHPVLLNIHGGPYANYDKAFFDEVQTYVEAGYAIVMCNPRGSAGYGTDHGRAIKDDMGNLDMVDIIAFLDHALEQHPDFDRERMGVMGGSYGGYMTAWIIAHDHRFKGAIVERGFLDSWSFIGSSDIGWFFPREYNGYERAEADRQSPMTHVDKVRTPTLVIHSEEDLRCPLHQALQYHTLLRANGVDSELMVFPGENHELSRSGTPWHRRQRFEKILEFWQRVL